MTCSSPPPLTQDEISAALDGTAEEGIMRHLANCPHCAARVETARQLEASLRRQLRRWNCPPPTALGEYHLGLLAGADAEMIGAHLSDCPACRAELDELRAFLASDAPTVPTEPERSRPRLPQVGALLGRLVQSQPALALRGESDGPLVIEAGAVTLFLEVDPGTGQPSLQGQLVADDLAAWQGALVQVWQGGALRTTAAIDDLGAFRCSGFALEPLALRLQAPGGAAIVVPEIELSG